MFGDFHPVMEPNELSSNWKKLQQTLKADTTRPPKQKACESILKPQRNGVKYRKVEKSKPHPHNGTSAKGKGMGLRWSSVKEDRPSASLALWAEDHDISAKDLAAAYGTSHKNTSIPDRDTEFEDRIDEGLSPVGEAGKFIAIDCEMVGVGPIPDADSALARISVVNYHGHQIYDSYVQTKEAVTDYRTSVSGITPQLLRSARTFEAVQSEVAKLIDGKILVGHAIKNDLQALLLSHPKRDIRDTSRHPAFRQLAGGKTPSLKKLAREVLGADIQGGEHSSIEDARATMLLFRREKEAFEKEHMKRFGPDYRRSNGMVEDEGRKGNHSRKKRKKKKKIGK